MSTGNRPVGEIVALVDRPNDRRATDFVVLAPVWRSREKGNLTFSLNAEPVAWRNSKVRRSCMLRLAEGSSLTIRREGNFPVADIVAIVDRPDSRDSDFIPIASVWQSKKGNLVFTLQAIPVAWLSNDVARRCMVRVRNGVELELSEAADAGAGYGPDDGMDVDVDVGGGAPPAGGSDDIPF